MSKNVVPEARIALQSFKEEIARELGLESDTYAGYVGGNMVKRMIEIAERQLVDNHKP